MLRDLGHHLKENYEKAKAELKGEARSEARLVLNGHHVPMIQNQLRREGGPAPAQRIPGAYIRMKDGNPMQYADDGSIRHAAGEKPGKAAKKARKKENRRRYANR